MDYTEVNINRAKQLLDTIAFSDWSTFEQLSFGCKGSKLPKKHNLQVLAFSKWDKAQRDKFGVKDEGKLMEWIEKCHEQLQKEKARKEEREEREREERERQADIKERERIEERERQEEIEKLTQQANVLELVSWNESVLSNDLNDKSLYFVNRHRPITDLTDILRNNYIRTTTGIGDVYSIALADNVYGLGKTCFSRSYIQKVKEARSKETTPDPFVEYLCQSRTVRIEMKKGDLCDLKDDKLKAFVQSQIASEIDRITGSSSSSSLLKLPFGDFLKLHVKFLGPLFIVFDEMGIAFAKDGIDAKTQRDLFMKFCETVFGEMLFVRGIFILVCGRGRLFNYVGARDKEEDMTGSPYKFKRLPLNLIRSQYIVEILKNTTFKGAQLQNVLHIEDAKLKEVADSLFKKTSGHPRNLMRLLYDYCRSTETKPFSEFVKDYDVSDIFGDKLRLNDFVSRLWARREPLKVLLTAMDQNRTFDLTKEYKDSGGKTIPYDVIASDSFIAWEGTINDATLRTQAFVKEICMNFALPFDEYLERINRIKDVSIDYPLVFEWLCLKRLQQLFSQPKHGKAYSFFDTPVLGNCLVHCSEQVIPFPKITKKGNVCASLSDATATPECLGKLIEEVDSYENVCVKPLPQSSSMDSASFCKTQLSKTTVARNQRSTTKACAVQQTVGIASKNLKGSSFSVRMLHDECIKFNRMFKDVDCRNRVNVLLICATNYDEALLGALNGKQSVVHEMKGYDKINEIILLNLRVKGFFEDPSALSDIFEKSERELKSEESDL